MTDFTKVRLRHTATLPQWDRIRLYQQFPQGGPPIAIFSGGSAARALAETLVNYSHRTAHILPMFDDGGSSRELRLRLKMPPPGDLRNRLIALIETRSPQGRAIKQLLQKRLPKDHDHATLRHNIEAYRRSDHPEFAALSTETRTVLLRYFENFCSAIPADFDLRDGSIGNFILAGAFLELSDMQRVVDQLSAVISICGRVHPICLDAEYYLKAEFEDGSYCVGQSLITQQSHPPIRRLTTVQLHHEDWCESRPPINAAVEKTISSASLIAFAMGSFYTSLVSSLLVGNVGQVIRRATVPKVFVANLTRDRETPDATVSRMLRELLHYLRCADSRPGEISDYVNYVLVNDHGEDTAGGKIPVDVANIRELGVEVIALPLCHPDDTTGQSPVTRHNADLVAATLLSLS